MFEKIFTTNEFAKFVGVSKHTLFYYDKEGVFCPAQKNDNGFRGYSIFQIETFLVIKSLAEIGVSLSNIKEYLKTRSELNCMMLLEENEKILEEKIERLKKAKELVKEKKQTIKDYLECKEEGVFIAFEEKERLFITKSDENDYYMPFTEHIKNVGESTLNLPCAVGHIIRNENMQSKEYFDYYFSKTKLRGKSTLIKPAGNYLNYYHKNGYYTIEEAYKKVLDHADEHNINLGEYFFEYMVLDEIAVAGIENYVVKISIKIKE